MTGLGGKTVQIISLNHGISAHAGYILGTMGWQPQPVCHINTSDAHKKQYILPNMNPNKQPFNNFDSGYISPTNSKSKGPENSQQTQIGELLRSLCWRFVKIANWWRMRGMCREQKAAGWGSCLCAKRRQEDIHTRIEGRHNTCNECACKGRDKDTSSSVSEIPKRLPLLSVVPF